MTNVRRAVLIPAAVLSLVLAFALAALAAEPIQERTITDDVSPPSKTFGSGKAAPDATNAPAAASAPAAKPADKPSSDWTPPAGTKVEKGPSRSKKSEPVPAESGTGSYDSPSSASSAPAASGEDVFSMANKEKTYGKNEIDREVMGFFEGGSQGLAELIAKAFKDLGRPTGFIKGGEGAGALVVGLRYGEGKLTLKNGQTKQVYWQSPSIGFDFGANASKVFVLVYNLDDVNKIFQRFPGVDGSAYLVGGFGMNYQQSGNVILAPIRFGVGLRLGANVGYMNYSRERTINPF